MICPTEEDGQNPDFPLGFVDLEVEDEIPAGDSAQAGPDLRMLATSMRMSLEASQITEGFADAGAGALRRGFGIVAESDVCVEQVFLDQVEVSGEPRSTQNSTALHAARVCVAASRASPPHLRRDR